VRSGSHGETINHVALDHGDRHDAAGPWVQVGVIGPLHGEEDVAGLMRPWSTDPLPMVLVEMLNAAGVEFTDGAELQQAQDRVLTRKPVGLELPVDGKRTPFRRWQERSAWAAVHDLAPDHLLYVVGRNLEPTTVELSSDIDLRRYRRPTHP
jgi:hypothetical protein